jgi:hypothetical protein
LIRLRYPSLDLLRFTTRLVFDGILFKRGDKRGRESFLDWKCLFIDRLMLVSVQDAPCLVGPALLLETSPIMF